KNTEDRRQKSEFRTSKLQAARSSRSRSEKGGSCRGRSGRAARRSAPTIRPLPTGGLGDPPHQLRRFTKSSDAIPVFGTQAESRFSKALAAWTCFFGQPRRKSIGNPIDSPLKEAS